MVGELHAFLFVLVLVTPGHVGCVRFEQMDVLVKPNLVLKSLDLGGGFSQRQFKLLLRISLGLIVDPLRSALQMRECLDERQEHFKASSNRLVKGPLLGRPVGVQSVNVTGLDLSNDVLHGADESARYGGAALIFLLNVAEHLLHPLKLRCWNP